MSMRVVPAPAGTRSRAAFRMLKGALIATVLASCATPEYEKPALDMPAKWKLEAPWREGTPADGLPTGPWGARFGDAEADALGARPHVFGAPHALDFVEHLLARLRLLGLLPRHVAADEVLGLLDE